MKDTSETLVSIKSEMKAKRLQIQAENQELADAEDVAENQENQISTLPPLDNAAEIRDLPMAIGLVNDAEG